VRLPIIARDHFLKGYPRVDLDQRPGGTRGLALGKEFPFQAGQPETVRVAFRQAMGLDAG
jgi:hypothetical protein